MSYEELPTDQSKKRGMNTFPFVSIVIAAFNAEKTIRRCIESLLSLDYPNYEIIAVDNNSYDRTSQIIKSYDIIYLYERKKGWPAARNYGIRYSQAKFIANIDSDCFAEKDWLKILIERLVSEPDIGGVIGRTKVEKGKTLAEQYYAECDPFNIEKYIGKTSYVPWGGGNNVYRREVFDKIGYYDSSRYISGASIEFHHRLNRLTNYRVEYVREAIIYHIPRGSVREFFVVSAKYAYDGFLRSKQYPELKYYYRYFFLKKIKEISKNILGFFYRLVKFLSGRETRIRVIEPFFATVNLSGSIYGYYKAHIKFFKEG